MDEQALCEKAVKYFNELFEADPNAMLALIRNRVPCNQKMVDHPNVVCHATSLQGNHYQVGLLGVIVGMMQAMGFSQTIAASVIDEVDNEGGEKLLGFNLVKFNK